MSEETVQVVKTMYKEFGAGNLEGALAVMAEDVVWDEGDGHPYGDPVKGKEAVKEKVFQRLGSEWEGMVTDPTDFLDCREFVVVLGTDDATFKATGKKVSSSSVAHIFRVHDGKITSFKQYCDTLAWHEAMKP